MKIQLEDIVPEGASFYLRMAEKNYKMNPVTLSDELWMNKTFGADQIELIFKEVRMKEICRIVFRLMCEEDKEDFLARDVKFINEEGEIMEKRVGGAELLYCMISGAKEKLEIFEALLQTIGVSRPLQKKFADSKSDDSQKKTQSSAPTGEKSSISSPKNMAGQPNTSLRAPLKKSPSVINTSRRESS